MYEPIVLVYDGNKLIGAAHGKGTELVTVIDPSDKDITKSIPLKEIVEIKTALKQIELF
jgi:uncharacterized FlaG/YvyC family protein